jgi:hypothetical protein
MAVRERKTRSQLAPRGVARPGVESSLPATPRPRTIREEWSHHFAARYRDAAYPTRIAEILEVVRLRIATDHYRKHQQNGDEAHFGISVLIDSPKRY